MYLGLVNWPLIVGPGSPGTIRYDRDAILTCAQKPTRVSLIYRTEPTTKKCKNKKTKSRKTDMLRNNSKQSGEFM